MCSRTTLCLVIAYLNLIGSCFGVIFQIVALVDKDVLKTVAIDFGSSLDTARAIAAVYLVLSGISTVISAVLCTGIHKKRHRLILPWLVASAIIIGLYFIGAIVALFTLTEPASKVIHYTISLIIQCICTYLIYIFYKDLKDEN